MDSKVNNGGDDEPNDSILYKVADYYEKPIWNSYATPEDLITLQPLVIHPITYMTTLVRIGYEPLPPTLTKSIFGRTQLTLPGFFTYMRYIGHADGFFGIFRGLKFHFSYVLVSRFVSVNMDRHQKQNYFQEIIDPDAKHLSLRHLSLSITCDLLTKWASLTVAYPLHLMMVRSMSQFIGRETYYDSLLGAITDIYQTGGIAGFYAGYFPFLCGESLAIILESVLLYFLLNKFREYDHSLKNSFIKTTVNFVVRTITYPFVIVSTVMSCNGHNSRSLAASAYTAPEYRNWTECMKTLWQQGEIKRGSSIMWRNQPISSTYRLMPRPIQYSRTEF